MTSYLIGGVLVVMQDGLQGHGLIVEVRPVAVDAARAHGRRGEVVSPPERLAFRVHARLHAGIHVILL